MTQQLHLPIDGDPVFLEHQWYVLVFFTLVLSVPFGGSSAIHSGGRLFGVGFHIGCARWDCRAFLLRIALCVLQREFCFEIVNLCVECNDLIQLCTWGFPLPSFFERAVLEPSTSHEIVGIVYHSLFKAVFA